MRGYGIPPIAEEEERTPGATLEVDEIQLFVVSELFG